MRTVLRFIIIGCIVVLAGCMEEQPMACFEMDKQIITVDMEINFTNCSENADSWLWDFGDGSTSAAFSPQHTYTQEGTYRISLTAFKDKKQNMAFYDVNILPKTD